MQALVAAILVLAGTIAWAAAGFLAEASRHEAGASVLILGLLGLLQLIAGGRVLFRIRPPAWIQEMPGPDER